MGNQLSQSLLRQRLGDAIRVEREAQGLSLRKLGLMVGVDYKRLCEMEQGKANATINTLLRVSVGLNVPLSSLIEKAEKGCFRESYCE